MRLIWWSILNLTLLALSGQCVVLPPYAICKEITPASDMNVASGTYGVNRKTVTGTTASVKQSAIEKVGVKNLRCPDNQPWTDEIVAKSIKVPVERLKALKAARSMTNNQVCTFPDQMLQRAWKKLETGKAGYPEEWAEFHNLRRRSDDGTIKADGLIKGHEHRKAVLRKIAEKRNRKNAMTNSFNVLQETTDLSGTDRTTIDIPSSGVDINLAGISSNQWTEIGPGNIGGRIRAIAIDPANSNSIWAGGVAGGIYHSSDYGASFSPVNDFMANLAISSIIIDPSNPNTMYAGTGEGFFNADGVRGYGVFKSIDRGVTWNQLAATVPSTTLNDYNYSWYYVNRLAISGNGATLLAATRGYYSNGFGGIFRSTDGGTTWSRSYSTARVYDVRFDPNDSNKALAAAQTYNSGTSLYDNSIIKSTDGGISWTAQKVISSASRIRIELAYAKANSQIVYASIDQNSGEIWKSTDGGTTWSLMATPQHLGNQGWYDNAIWVDPSDPNAQLVVAAGLDVYRSTNGGTSWTKASNWGNNQIDVRYNGGTSHTPHADHHALVSDPNYNGSTNRVLYNGNDGGLYRAPDITLAGETSGWDELNNGIALTQFYSVAGHSSGGARIVGGSQDNGMLCNGDSGVNWKMFQGGDGGFSAVDSTNDNYLYGEYVYLQISRVTDSGSSGSSTYIDKTGASQLTDSRSSSTANFIAPFVLDPNDQNRMLAGGVSLWQNIAVRSGTSWTAIKSSTGSKISAIAVAEGNSAIIWVGHNNGSVYRTANGTDATPTWTLVSGGIGQARIVNRIVIDKDNPAIVYVSFGGYNNNNLWRTTDNGSTWSDLNSPARVLPAVPIFGLARHTLNANWLYAGTEVGLFTSQDGGVTWSTSNDGPANVEIADLAWRDNTTLIAATHGRGMFLATAGIKTNTTTTVASGANPSTYGASVALTATVSSSSATGTVTFFDGATYLGSAAVSSGTATYSTASLGAGSHSISVSYGGDGSFNTSISPAITQTVNPANLSVTAAAKSKVYGNSDPPLTYSVTGFVNGDTTSIMTGNLIRATGEAVGNYAILQGTVACGSNYSISYTGANLTIIPAVVRLVIPGQPDVFTATIANAISNVPAGGSATLRLLNGDIVENLDIAIDATLEIAGGFDTKLLIQSTGGVTRLRGNMTITNGKVSVSNLALY